MPLPEAPPSALPCVPAEAETRYGSQRARSTRLNRLAQRPIDLPTFCAPRNAVVTYRIFCAYETLFRPISPLASQTPSKSLPYSTAICTFATLVGYRSRIQPSKAILGLAFVLEALSLAFRADPLIPESMLEGPLYTSSPVGID